MKAKPPGLQVSGRLFCLLSKGHLYFWSNGHLGTLVLLYVSVISIMILDCHLPAYFHLLFLATIRAVILEQF